MAETKAEYNARKKIDNRKKRERLRQMWKRAGFASMADMVNSYLTGEWKVVRVADGRE